MSSWDSRFGLHKPWRTVPVLDLDLERVGCTSPASRCRAAITSFFDQLADHDA